MDLSGFDPKMMFEHPDPYPMFAMLRHTMPVFETMFMTRPGWVVSRYDDCLAILRDADGFSSKANAEVGKVMGRTIIEMDGKEHSRTRALVQSMFVPKNMEAMPSVMQPMIDELLDRVAAGANRADLVTQFTEHFPVQVVAHLIDVPRKDYPRFQEWAIKIIGFPKDMSGAIAASKALHDYLLPVVQERRRNPGEDVISRLVTGKVDGEGLTDEQVISFLRLLAPAGAETTFRLIGNMLVALLTERDRYERVRADRSLVPWAIEETLRWETSVLMVAREATREVEMRGVTIPAGGMVSVVVASANRDETKYENPDVFDLDRRADDHLALGFGRHHCLGAHVAKMEARLALNAIMDRWPNLRLDPDADAPHILGLAFRSPDAVRVLLS